MSHLMWDWIVIRKYVTNLAQAIIYAGFMSHPMFQVLWKTVDSAFSCGEKWALMEEDISI